MTGHYKEKWEDQQAMYIGLRYPEDRKKRKRRKHAPRGSGKGISFDEPASKNGAGIPAASVTLLYYTSMFLLMSSGNEMQ